MGYVDAEFEAVEFWYISTHFFLSRNTPQLPPVEAKSNHDDLLFYLLSKCHKNKIFFILTLGFPFLRRVHSLRSRKAKKSWKKFRGQKNRTLLPVVTSHSQLWKRTNLTTLSHFLNIELHCPNLDCHECVAAAVESQKNLKPIPRGYDNPNGL